MSECTFSNIAAEFDKSVLSTLQLIFKVAIANSNDFLPRLQMSK